MVRQASKLKIKDRTNFGLGLSFFLFAASAFSQVSSIQFEIKPFLKDSELSISDVYHVTTVLRPNNAGWAEGINGNVNPSWFSLKSVDGDAISGVSDQLEIDFTMGKKQPVSARVCSPTAICKPTAVESKGNKHNFAVDGTNWQIKLAGNPCIKGNKCSFRSPSWALGQRASIKKAMSPFPQTATIVHHKNGLTIFDTSNSREWATYNFGESSGLNHLGNLRGSAMGHDGRLLLKFNNGFLIFDWPEDRVFLFDGSGISISISGIGKFDRDGFSNIVKRGSEASDKPLFADSQVAVWSDGYAPMDMTQRPADRVSKGFVNFTEYFVDATRYYYSKNQAAEYSAASKNGSGFSHWSYNPKSQKFEVLKIVNTTISERLIRVMRQGLMRKNNKGLFLITSEGQIKRTSLVMSDKEILLHGTGHAFVQKMDDKDCKWVHFSAHEKIAWSFKESGLEMQCGVINDSSESSSAIVMSVFDGVSVSVSTFRPQGKTP